VTYAVVEADEHTPSHDARAGFRKTPGGNIKRAALDDPAEGRQTGKQAIEDALLGSVVTDVRALSELQPSARNASCAPCPRS